MSFLTLKLPQILKNIICALAESLGQRAVFLLFSSFYIYFCFLPFLGPREMGFPSFSSCLHLYCSKTLCSRPSSLPLDMLKREIKIKKIKPIFIFFPFPLSPLPPSSRPLSFSISLLIKDLTSLCIILFSPTQKGKLRGLD